MNYTTITRILSLVTTIALSTFAFGGVLFNSNPAFAAAGPFCKTIDNNSFCSYSPNTVCKHYDPAQIVCTSSPDEVCKQDHNNAIVCLNRNYDNTITP